MRMTTARFMMSYVLIILVTFVAIVPIYRTSVSAIREKAGSDLFAAARTGIATLDKELGNIQNAANNISMDPEFLMFSMRSVGEADVGACVPALIRLQKKLSTYALAFDVTQFSHVLFQNSPFVLTNTRVFLSDVEFYGTFFRAEDWDREKWRGKACGEPFKHTQPAGIYAYDSGASQSLMVTYPLPADTSRSKIFYTVYLDMNRFMSRYIPAEILEHGWIDLCADGGRVLYSTSQSFRVPSDGSLPRSRARPDARNAQIIKIAMDNEPLYFWIALPDRMLTPLVQPVKTLMGTYVFATIAAGVLLSYLLSYHNAERVRLSLKQMLFDRLMHGLITTRDDLREARLCLKNFPACYRVLLLHYNACSPPDNLDSGAAHTLLCALERRGLPDSACFSYIEPHIFAALLPADPDLDEKAGHERALQQAAQLMGAVGHPARESSLVGISRPHLDICEAGAAYVEAKTALDGAELGAFSQIRFYTPSAAPYSSLSLAELQKLSSLILAGEGEEAVRYLREALGGITADYKLPLYQVVGLIMNLCDKLPFPVRMDMPQKGMGTPYPVQLGRVISIIQDITSQISRRRKSRRVQLKDAILDYIGEHFRDSQLSAWSISKHFDINEKYLSSFVHEQTGRSYSEILENLRLTESARMLRQSALPIAEVAAQCGFNSQNTFYKAFRRAYALSPSVYREKHLDIEGGLPDEKPRAGIRPE